MLLRTTVHRVISRKGHEDEEPEEGYDFKQKVDGFIRTAEEHFDRDVPFVLDKLNSLEQIKDITSYEEGLFRQYLCWARRLTVSL